MTKLVRSGWLDSGQVLFCVFIDRDGVEVRKRAKKWLSPPGTRRVIPSGRDNSILPTRVAN